MGIASRAGAGIRHQVQRLAAKMCSFGDKKKLKQHPLRPYSITSFVNFWRKIKSLDPEQTKLSGLSSAFRTALKTVKKI